VSVVVVNYNGEQFLGPCLESLLGQTCGEAEIIVVDNMSTDDSIRGIPEKYPSVTLIRNSSNLGFAAGCNAGIRASHGDYILTLNHDTRLSPTFIDHIARPMHEDPAVGICASKMVFPDGRINSAGLCIAMSGASWNRGMFEQDSGQYDRPQEVFGACAGAALYRRSMLEEAGLFEEGFFLFFEDVDISLRAGFSGWSCKYVPSAVAIHAHGASVRYKSDTAVFYGNRNMLLNVVKNYPIPWLALCMPWIVGRNLGNILYYGAKGRGAVVLRAKAEALKTLPQFIRKRRAQNKRLSSTRALGMWLRTWAPFQENSG